MNRLVGVVIFACLFSPALAQTATGVGTGVGVARSSSTSGAVAIGGGNASNSLTTNPNSSSSVTINSTSPANTTTTETVNNSGSIKNVPTAFAPGLAAAGLETCLGSVSGGGSALGWGASFGTTIPDPGCAARLDARTLWSMGLKKAAVARLCLMSDIYASMPDVCQKYMPPRPQYGFITASVTPAVQPAAYTGGSVEVVVKRTGKTGICDDYDVNRQRCRVRIHD